VRKRASAAYAGCCGPSATPKLEMVQRACYFRWVGTQRALHCGLRGVSLITAFHPALEVRLTGPAVGPGRLAARDLADLARLLDLAVLRVARILYRAGGRGAGARSRDVEAACRLYLVSWSEGSAVAGFDLAQPQARKPGLLDIGQRSVHHFVGGLSRMAVEEPIETPLPEGFDKGVLETCTALGKLLDHGIETLSFFEPSRRQAPLACYDLSLRRRIRAVLDREHVLAHRAKTEAPRRTRTSLTEPGIGSAPSAIESSFWKSASLDELAADQGVLPIMDMRELDGVWSEGDVFDDALSELLRDRAQRRGEGRVR